MKTKRGKVNWVIGIYYTTCKCQFTLSWYYNGYVHTKNCKRRSSDKKRNQIPCYFYIKKFYNLTIEYLKRRNVYAKKMLRKSRKVLRDFLLENAMCIKCCARLNKLNVALISYRAKNFHKITNFIEVIVLSFSEVISARVLEKYHIPGLKFKNGLFFKDVFRYLCKC